MNARRRCHFRLLHKLIVLKESKLCVEFKIYARMYYCKMYDLYEDRVLRSNMFTAVQSNQYVARGFKLAVMD